MPGLQLAYDTTLERVLLAQSRRDRLDKAIAEMARDLLWGPVVSRLQCLRGVLTLTSFGLAVKIGEWTRFTGSSIGAFLGLVPTEHSSGDSRVQGSITKTGNTHARRLLVEAAWHHRRPCGAPLKVMRARWDQAPAAARARGHAGNQRLHARWISFNDCKKRPVIANVAVARELAGWCWSLATLTPANWSPPQPSDGASDDQLRNVSGHVAGHLSVPRVRRTTTGPALPRLQTIHPNSRHRRPLSALRRAGDRGRPARVHLMSKEPAA